jgi:hypothetical protein
MKELKKYNKNSRETFSQMLQVYAVIAKQACSSRVTFR